MARTKKTASASSGGDALDGLVFCISGTLSLSRKEFETLITRNGGKCTSSVTKTTTHLITTEKEYEDETTKVKKAKENEIIIVREQFVHDCIEKGSSNLVSPQKYSLEGPVVGEEESDDDDYVEEDQKRGEKRKREESQSDDDGGNVDGDGDGDDDDDDDEGSVGSGGSEEQQPKRKRRKVDVDPAFPSDATVVMHEDTDYQYSVNLLNTDGSNKFYKMQLLQTVPTQFAVFAKYGVNDPSKKPRTITKNFKSLNEAKKHWEKQFKSKTGNTWDNYVQGNFEKKDGSYYVEDPDQDPNIDPDDCSSDEDETMVESGSLEKINFLELPDDTQLHVFEFCDYRTIGRLIVLNHRFNTFIDGSDHLWKMLFNNNTFTYGKIAPKESELQDSESSDDDEEDSEKKKKKREENYTKQEVKQKAFDHKSTTVELLKYKEAVVEKLFSRMKLAMEILAKKTGISMSVSPALNYKFILKNQISLSRVRGLKTKLLTQSQDSSDLDIFTQIKRFLNMQRISKFKRLNVRSWGDMTNSANPVIKALLEKSERLQGIEALDIANVSQEDCEISWIVLGDFTPLFNALPNLKYFSCHGSQELTMGPITHMNLRSITLTTGGLPATVIQQIFQSTLPQLIELELWIGTADYGCSDWKETKEAFQVLFTPEENGCFPLLQYLRLKNAQQIDYLLEPVVSSAIVKRIIELDLSEGCLGDYGAEQLLKLNDLDTCLRSINIEHHYITKKTNIDALLNMKIAFLGLFSFGDIDDSYFEEDDDPDSKLPWMSRYVSVGE